MQFQTPLVPARLIRRYKRFLADIVLDDGREAVAHCANPGAMTGLADEGTAIWVEPNDDPKKKLDWAWRLVDLPRGGMACIDTALPNRLVAEALAAGRVPGLAGYDLIRREVPYGENSRVDFVLSARGRRDAYVEVKAVTLRRHGKLAEFPDTVTKRGTRHLNELAAMAETGSRAVMLYVVARSDCAQVTLAGDIDPAYAAGFRAARAAGVEVLAYGVRISPRALALGAALPFADP
ncbi:MAG: DNA/RNA nuclease SfsA [Rhodobacteraceae bacterium]|nr:DNA/RNA nuclease SfsA [Paracoccaceae bacterium]